MVRFWWFVIEWLLFAYCCCLEILSRLRSVSFNTCADLALVVLYCMSIFKKVAAWPWKKILTVVVKVAYWLLEKLPADPPKSPKA